MPSSACYFQIYSVLRIHTELKQWALLFSYYYCSFFADLISFHFVFTVNNNY
jgi:hypothetical protein